MTPSHTSTILSRRDVEFLLYEWLNVEQLTGEFKRFEEHDRPTFDSILELAETIATEKFRPHNRAADLNPPHLVDGKVVTVEGVQEALNAFSESGLVAGTFDEELGGIQLPHVVHRACMMWFQAANTGTAAYPFLSMANANLLVAHGSQAQIDTFVRPAIEGRFYGTMCLSEPHAGSSLTDLLTVAKPDPANQEDGTSAGADSKLGQRYRIFGRKMWISAGEHELSDNIVHLVLAKTSDAPAGTGGLSLFIVPKYLVNEDGSRGERNDVSLAGLNHKMGFRGTTNTLLNFGEGTYTPEGAEGAIGYLVGEGTEGLNKGLKYMFHMMNEARIGVGAGAAALGYTSYLEAVAYAKERPQGRAPSKKDPTSPMINIVEHADVKRMLLASKSYAEGSLALVLYAAKLLDYSEFHEDPAVRDEAHRLLEVLTPIVKSWPSQWTLVANDHAIQVHGGSGYTQDFNVEQHYRDNRLNPIHEGTHGIHGLDLLGRKAIMNKGQDFELLLSRIDATAAAAAAAGVASESASESASGSASSADPATGSGSASGASAATSAVSATDAASKFAGYASALTKATARIRAVTAKLWDSSQPGWNPDNALSNATLFLESVGHVVVAWLWLEQALTASKTGQAPSQATSQAPDTDDAFYKGKLAAAAYFFTYELPKIDSQLTVLEGQQGFLNSIDPAWF